MSANGNVWTRRLVLGVGVVFVLFALVLMLRSPMTQEQDPGTGEAPGSSVNPQRNLSGKWVRDSPFQTYGAVKGGANEFQAEIQDAQIARRQPDLSQEKARIKGLVYIEPVFTSAGKAAFDMNIPGYGLRITEPRLGNDPAGLCDPMGVPRMLNGAVVGGMNTWEIVQQEDRMIWLVPWMHEHRIVWTDGRTLPTLDEIENLTPNGFSVGRWEGDTFVVNSIGFDDKTWLDHNGYPHSEEMQLEERYRLLDADTLEFTMTIIDPLFYAEPFKSDVKIWKRDTVNLKQWDPQAYCVPSVEGRFNRDIRDGQVK